MMSNGRLMSDIGIYCQTWAKGLRNSEMRFMRSSLIESVPC